jgi:hypothetical protein
MHFAGRGERVPNHPHTGSHDKKKLTGKPVKPAGSVGLKKYRHGLGLGTGPVRVPDRSGSQLFGKHWGRDAREQEDAIASCCLTCWCAGHAIGEILLKDIF